MPKCLECGKDLPRLQWTHFKFNCTGKFKNGKEYIKAHPGAKIVDDSIVKSTAVTLANFIKKYGDEEGASRWETYKQKQAESNSFEYKKKKHNWTRDQFDAYNKSRSVTLENLIKKYGLELATKKWESYCDRQKYTKSKEYVIATYGEETWERLRIAKNAPHNPAIIAATYGITYEQAVEKIVARFQTRYTSNLELEFIQSLEQRIGPLEYTTLKKPFGRWNHYKDGYVVYDIKHNDCIIEFNGDYWHANPSIYGPNDLIRGKEAKEIWEHDAVKLKIVRDLGFRVRTVWERDYLHNKDRTINEVVDWILNTQK